VRTVSLATGTRTRTFSDAVRHRDRGCVVSGQANLTADIDDWEGYQATHIFPLAYEAHWITHNYHRWITIPAARGGSINSVQNGILMRNDLHQLFDCYSFSINPDVCIFCTCCIMTNIHSRMTTRLFSSNRWPSRSAPRPEVPQ
jgi:hypothetical protein